MGILDDLISRDVTRIWKACGEIRHLRNMGELSSLIENIELIRERTKNVDLGGRVRPNSTHLDLALRKLEFIRDGEGCFCKLYMLDDMFGPEGEQTAGNISIEAATRTPDGYIDHYRCKCSVCGAKYRVTEREYHYTWWKWELEENFTEKDS